MANGKVKRSMKSAEYWLFPQGTSVDITSQFNTSGAHYSVPEDCVIHVKYYGGFCEVEGSYDMAFSTGSGTSSSSAAAMPSAIKVICKKGAYLTMWVTGTVDVVIKTACSGN